MRKFTLFFLFSLIASTFGIKAQNIQDGVLISWPMASGDIKMPDEVVEIAPNCFYQSGGDWGDDDWESAGMRSGLRASTRPVVSGAEKMNGEELPLLAYRVALPTKKSPLSTSTKWRKSAKKPLKNAKALSR